MKLAQATRKFVAPYWQWYAAGLAALIVTTWLTIMIPQYSKTVVDGIVEGEPTEKLVTVSLMIIMLGLGQMLIRTLSRILIFWPGRKVEVDLKTYFFGKLIRLPMRFFQSNTTGDMVSRLANDIAQLRAFYAFGALQAINVTLLGTFIFYQMATVSLKLTLACLAPLSLIGVILRFGIPRMFALAREEQRLLGALSGAIAEVWSHIHTIKAQTCEDSFERRISAVNDDWFETELKLEKIRAIIFPSTLQLVSLTLVVILFVGGHEVIGGKMTVGDLVAFNIYIGMLGFPLAAIAIVVSLTQRARSALQRLEEIELEPQEARTPLVTVPLSTCNEALQINGLSFTYPDGERAAVRGASLTIARGDIIGLTGEVGCGKTTLLELIVRLHIPPPNTIMVNGRDVHDWPLKELRQTVGLVAQNTFLFSDSIAGNLEAAAGRKLSQEEMYGVLEQTEIATEVRNFPDGLDTQIGEKGVRLSGGQKQRLALAQMLLRDPAIYLLDDSSSGIDLETERALLTHLAGQGKTMLIVSHRDEILRRCQRVGVMADGKIVQWLERDTPGFDIAG